MSSRDVNYNENEHNSAAIEDKFVGLQSKDIRVVISPSFLSSKSDPGCVQPSNAERKRWFNSKKLMERMAGIFQKRRYLKSEKKSDINRTLKDSKVEEKSLVSPSSNLENVERSHQPIRILLTAYTEVKRDNLKDQKVNDLLVVNRQLQCDSDPQSLLRHSTFDLISREESQMVFQSSASSIELDKNDDESKTVCEICMCKFLSIDMWRLEQCGCEFCKQCLEHYVTSKVESGTCEIVCPSANCLHNGKIHSEEIENLSGNTIKEKYSKLRFNAEISKNKNLRWCPCDDCITVCHLPSEDHDAPVAVKCPECQHVFCSWCQEKIHQGVCTNIFSGYGVYGIGLEIKTCPVCRTPIERDSGCAQIQCKICNHAFCWNCLKLLDSDFLLRHYDKGACKGLLGHSRYAIVWHRIQVVGLCAALGVVFILASPLLLAAAPYFVCTNREESGQRQKNSPKSDWGNEKLMTDETDDYYYKKISEKFKNLV